MSYTVPKHLKGIIAVDEDHSDENNIAGKIVCTCGCERFGIFHNNDAEYDSTLGYGERDGLKVAVVCENCGQKHLLFDEAKHSYDGCVCGSCKSADDDSLEEMRCADCGLGAFNIRLAIEQEDRQQFIEEVVSDDPERFSPDDCADIFDWITIYVGCPECGTENEWISLELS